MTWGQLRLQLQTAAPGTSLDLIDEFLNGRYEQVLEANNWTGVKSHCTIVTQAAYQSAQTDVTPTPGFDGANVTVGSANVSIVNTPGQLPVIGQRFFVPGDTVFYTITALNTVPPGSILAATIANPGSGYIVGQQLIIYQGSATGGEFLVASVDPTGAALSMVMQSGGAGYAVANGVTTARVPGFPGTGATVNITAVTSSINFSLERPYEGKPGDGPGTLYIQVPYVYMQHIYTLPSDAGSLISVLDPVTGFPLQRMSKFNLDASAGPRTLVSDPQSYAEVDDTPDAYPPVLHQIEFYPPPLYARGMVIQYLHALIGFDGSSTSGSPVPWVSGTVLMYGARADIAAHLGNLNQATFYEKKFDEELLRLMRVEHMDRRPKTALKMAPRFTRHRLARAARAYNNAWRGGTPGGPT